MIYEILQKTYNITIRDYLPKKYRLVAGVAVRDAPLLDFTADDPTYKQGLMSAIEDGVGQNDDVDLVGFGRGVSAIRAFDAGANRITAYEASEEMIKLADETVTVNRPFDADLEVEQAIVGDAVKIYGNSATTKKRDPSDLCRKDVLILDCEGSEKSILENLGSYPDTIICETHPERGVPTRDVVKILRERYSIDLRDYEPDCSPKKKVVLGKRN